MSELRATLACTGRRVNATKVVVYFSFCYTAGAMHAARRLAWEIVSSSLQNFVGKVAEECDLYQEIMNFF